jgi:hypothetical protein
MLSHEHAMSDAVRSHETTLELLHDASAGLQFSELLVVCRHCDQLIHADRYSTWIHDESCSEACNDESEDSTFAAPTDDMVSMLESVGADPDDMEESTMSAIDNYALSVETETVLRVQLSVGGPTVEMTAVISRDQYGSWSRDSRVTFYDSWAVPNETGLSDDSYLVTLFDRFVETYQPDND